jgi:hypothetical protein
VIIHQLTVSPELVREIALGVRQALLVAADKAVMTGDQLVLREYRDSSSPRGFTGAWLLRRVTLVSSDAGATSGFRLVCLNTAVENEWAKTVLEKNIESGHRKGLDSDAVWAQLEKSELRLRVLRETSPVRATRERPPCTCGGLEYCGRCDEAPMNLGQERAVQTAM